MNRDAFEDMEDISSYTLKALLVHEGTHITYAFVRLHLFVLDSPILISHIIIIFISHINTQSKSAILLNFNETCGEEPNNIQCLSNAMSSVL